MRTPLRGLALALAATLTTASVPAQEEDPEAITLADGRAALEELEQSFGQAQQEWYGVYGAARTDEERQTALESRPNPDEWAQSFLALADEHPGTDVAADALVWVARFADDAKATALERLAADHLDEPVLAELCQQFWYAASEPARAFLEACLEGSPHEDVKAQAHYSLGKVWMNRASLARRLASDPGQRETFAEHYAAELLDLVAETGVEANQAKAEKILERVASDYADLEYFRGRTLGSKAEADLFELRHLNVGQVAPEIEGESIQGEPMKLSDFRGKVVVLDFWGHW